MSTACERGLAEREAKGWTRHTQIHRKNFPTNENISLIQSCIEKFENTPYEKEKLTIIKNVLDSNKDARMEKFQTQLKEFTQEYDKRRNKNFSKTFA